MRPHMSIVLRLTLNTRPAIKRVFTYSKALVQHRMKVLCFAILHNVVWFWRVVFKNSPSLTYNGQAGDGIDSRGEKRLTQVDILYLYKYWGILKTFFFSFFFLIKVLKKLLGDGLGSNRCMKRRPFNLKNRVVSKRVLLTSRVLPRTRFPLIRFFV